MSWQRSKETKRRNIKLYKCDTRHYGCGVWYNEEKQRYTLTLSEKYLRALERFRKEYEFDMLARGQGDTQ